MTDAPRRRRVLVRVAQAAVVAAVLWFAARALRGQWRLLRDRAAAVEPRWDYVAASVVLVLLTYALLIQSWRSLVRAWGDRLGLADAVRIWTVSNLGRYVPGKVWSIGAMGVMARQVGVSPAAAAGSAVFGTLANLAAGFAVLALVGRDTVRALFPAAEHVALALPVLGAAGVAAIPLLLPPTARVAAALSGRAYTPARVPAVVLLGVVAANTASWLMYGLAFAWLAAALLPDAAGTWGQYVAVFSGSYLAGYLALVVPGGLGVREVMMTAALVALGVTDAPGAALLAAASRVWLTVLELAPGLLFLAFGALRPASRTRPDVPV